MEIVRSILTTYFYDGLQELLINYNYPFTRCKEVWCQISLILYVCSGIQNDTLLYNLMRVKSYAIIQYDGLY